MPGWVPEANATAPDEVESGGVVPTWLLSTGAESEGAAKESLGTGAMPAGLSGDGPSRSLPPQPEAIRSTTAPVKAGSHVRPAKGF